VFRLLTEIENICLEKICTIFKNIRVNLSHLPVPKFNEKPITRSRGISTIVLKYRHANCTDLIGVNCTKSEQFNNRYCEIATNRIQKTGLQSVHDN